MRIIIACTLDSQSRAGFWKNDRATVHAVRTIQYNNLLFYLLLIIIYYSSDSPSSLTTESLSVLSAQSLSFLSSTSSSHTSRNASPIWCMNLMAHHLLALKQLRGMFKDVAFFIASSWSRSSLTNSPVLCLSWKGVKTASSISGNCPLLGPVNSLHNALNPLIAVLYFRHSWTLLSSTPKITVALRFPFSSVYQITSCLNFAIYDSLLDFWHPSSITTVHDKLEWALSTFQQLGCKLASDKTEHACWERPTWRYQYDSPSLKLFI